MKLAIVGSRSFSDLSLMLRTVQSNYPGITHIISGGAKGADSTARQVAEDLGIEIVEIKPDWKRFGRGAGPIRNKTIVEQADRVLAFWDGTSKGTKQAIEYARSLGKEVDLIMFNGHD